MKIKFVLSALVLGSVAMFLSSCNKDDFSIKGSWKAYKTTTECYVDDDLIYSKDSTLLRGPWYVFDDSTVTIIQEDKYGDRYSSTMAYEYSDGKLYINSVYTKGYAFQYEDGIVNPVSFEGGSQLLEGANRIRCDFDDFIFLAQ